VAARTVELSAANVTLQMNERSRVEIELRQAQKLEAVGRLASGIAHEINTPIQFVSDNVQFLREAIPDLFALTDKLRVVMQSVLAGTPDARTAREATEAEEKIDLPFLLEDIPKALDSSLDGLGRVATIVQSMKEFAHPDLKEMTSIDLNHSIQSTLTIARNEYKYVAEVETDFGDLPPVTCHPGDVNQAVLNIIVNAAHAIAEVVKGSDRKGRITIQTRREGERVLIAIRDTGGGIPADIRHRIFDPFFTTKGVGRGTGQGLAIAHSVVTVRHGGELSFETEVGKGTTFFVRLPIAGQRKAAVAA
jgi:signal transduction histidine kinase